MRKHIILYLCDALRSCGSFVSRNWSGRCYGSGGRVSTFVFGSPRFKSRRRRRVWFIHHLHGPPTGNTHISLRVLPCNGSSDLANGQSPSTSRLMAFRLRPLTHVPDRPDGFAAITAITKRTGFGQSCTPCNRRGNIYVYPLMET